MSIFSALCVEEYTDGSAQVLSYAGTAGQILTSNGPNTQPSFKVLEVGKLFNSVVVTGSSVALTSGTAKNVASMSLTPGTYAMTGIVAISGAVATLGNQMAGVSTTSANVGTVGNNAVSTSFVSLLGDITLNVPNYVLTLASVTNVYLVAQVTFGLGNLNAYGRLTAIKLS